MTGTGDSAAPETACAICGILRAVAVQAAYSLLVLLFVAIIAFVGLRLAPGDVTTQILDPARATPAELAALRREIGLDQPILIQFWAYISGLFRGDFGKSLLTRESVASIVAVAGSYTVTLALTAFVAIYAVALPAGILAATMRGSIVDRTITTIASVFMATPNFVLAILLVNVLALYAGWLPVAGAGSWKNLVLPALVISADPMGFATRLVRTSYLEQASAPYADSFRLRGIRESAIRWRHILRNALLPVISLAAVQVRTLVGYTLIVETIFRWPGLGKRLVDSVLTRDYFLAQGLTILLALVVVVATLVSAVLYRIADPRVRDA